MYLCINRHYVITAVMNLFKRAHSGAKETTFAKHKQKRNKATRYLHMHMHHIHTCATCACACMCMCNIMCMCMYVHVQHYAQLFACAQLFANSCVYTCLHVHVTRKQQPLTITHTRSPMYSIVLRSRAPRPPADTHIQYPSPSAARTHP